MSLVKEFMEFVKKYEVLGLAIAFVIGAASKELVTAAVNDLIMPIVAVLIPGGDWRTSVLSVGPFNFLLGHFTGALIDFLIVALVIFMVVKYVMKDDTTKKR